MVDDINYITEQEQYAKKDFRNSIIFWILVVVLHTLLFVPALFAGPWSLNPFNLLEGGFELHWIHIASFLTLILNSHPASWASQKQGYVGGKNAFGALVYQTGPGIIYLFWGICTHDSEECRLNNAEIPTDLPDRYNPDENGRLVLRMTSAHAKDDIDEKVLKAFGNVDPLSTGRLTLEGTIPFEWALDSTPGAWRQWLNRIGSVERLIQIVDDRVVGEVRKQVVSRTPSEVFTDWSGIEQEALGVIDRATRGCGINQLHVRIKEFDLPHKVNTALAERTEQHTNVEKGRLAGLESKQRDEGIAEGKKALTVKPLEGIVAELAKARKKSSLDASNEELLKMLWTQEIGGALENADYSIIPAGKGGMFDPASMMALMEEGRKASSVNTQNVPNSDTPSQEKVEKVEGGDSND